MPTITPGAGASQLIEYSIMANLGLAPTVGALQQTGGAAGNYPSSALLFITEFESAFRDSKSGTELPRAPSIVDQPALPFGGVSVATPPFSPTTRIVRIQPTAACIIKVGGAQAVAVAGAGSRMTAGQTEFYAVRPNDTVAVITSA
jgi:hypothetical protein